MWFDASRFQEFPYEQGARSAADAGPNGPLESELINEYLRTRGYDLRSLDRLPDDERRQLLREASMHASGKLTEIEARAHFVHELHGDTDKG